MTTLPTKPKCSVCGCNLIKSNNLMRTSVPPSYQYHCSSCKNIEYLRDPWLGDNITMPFVTEPKKETKPGIKIACNCGEEIIMFFVKDDLTFTISEGNSIKFSCHKCNRHVTFACNKKG